MSKSKNSTEIIDLNNNSTSKTAKRLEQYKKLGLNISYYRKLKGITQIELAERTNLSRTYVSNIEAPKVVAVPSIPTLLDIADELDVDIALLFASR